MDGKCADKLLLTERLFDRYSTSHGLMTHRLSSLAVPIRSSLTLLCWALTIAVVLIYAALMHRQIMAHTALPYFDQATYVAKVQNLAALMDDGRGARALLNPGALLATNPTARGFLMPLAAAVTVGPDADTRLMALVWLGVRLTALVAALAVLAHVNGRPEFLPATVMVILGSAPQLTLNPSLYMMDQTFESFGLLVFALALHDIARRSAGSATVLGLVTLMLVLVKPAGVVFIAPLYAVIAIFAITRKRWRWALPHAITLILIGLLGLSPYGAGVRQHYLVALADYWWGLFTVPELVRWTIQVIPTWLAVLAAISLVKHGHEGLPRGLLLFAGLTVVGWFVFNVLLTHVIDPRMIVAVMPVVVSALALVACRTKVLAWVATLGAAVVFGLAIASAAGQLLLPWYLNYVHGLPAAQLPVREVGLLPLGQRIAADIDRAEPGSAPVAVAALVQDNFVDAAGLALVLRRARSQGASRIQPADLPMGSDPAPLESALAVRWFVTKATRKAVTLRGDAWTTLLALDRLITDPGSPLHDYFERRVTHIVLQPDLEDEVTLWRLRRRPTAATFLRALQWLEPRFRETVGHAALLLRIDGLDKALARLPSQEIGAVDFHIDRLEAAAPETRIDGWAFAPGLPNAGDQVLVALQDPTGGMEVFHTTRVLRPDVSAYFRRADLDDSGFSIVLPHVGLASGRYRLGLYVSAGETSALRFTPHTVVVN